MSRLSSFIVAGVLIAGAAQANAASPVLAKYYDNFTEVAGVGVTFAGNPYFTETLPDINFDFSVHNGPAARPTEATIFGADYTGSIFAGAAGVYNFTFGSDDAGYLFIDGNLVGSLPGTHSYYSSVFATTLTAGAHALEVQYYNSFCCGSTVTLQLDPAIIFSDPTAAPEPASWAMMIGGFCMIGGALRRTRRAATTSIRFA